MFRFTLRSIAFFVFLFSVYFAYFYVPRTITKKWHQDSGGISFTYSYRPLLSGKRLLIGPARLVYKDGRTVAVAHVEGQVFEDIGNWWIPLDTDPDQFEFYYPDSKSVSAWDFWDAYCLWLNEA